MGDSDVQNITGGKTFLNQTLKRRNPANTFTLTDIHPAITADKDHRFYQPYHYLVKQEGSTYYVINGTTDAVDSSSSNALTALQYANDNLTAARTNKEKIVFMGDYTAVSTPLLLDSNTVLESYGRLKLANAANCPIVKNRTWTITEGSQDHDIELVGGEYDGNKANQTLQYLIYFEDVNRLTIRGVYSHDAYNDGIAIAACDDVDIIGCRLNNNGTAGVRGLGLRATGGLNIGCAANDLRVIDNEANGNGVNGLWAQGPSSTFHYNNVSMIGNVCQTNLYGLYIDWNVTNWTVVGNTCSNNGDGGVSSGGGIVINGQANGTPYFGNFPGVVIGNSCYGNKNDGMEITWVRDVKVIGNVCHKNSWNGILFYGSQRCEVTNNTCIDNSQAIANTWSGIDTISATGTDTILYPTIDFTIKDNKCYDTVAAVGSRTQKYGISVRGTAYNNIIRNNYVRNNRSGSISTVDLSSCYDNEGFITKRGRWTGANPTFGEGVLGNNVSSFDSLGTATISKVIDSTGVHTNYLSSATTGHMVGGKTTTFTEGDLNCVFKCKFKLASGTERFFFGFHSNVASNPVTSGTPLNNYHGIGIYYDSASVVNWRTYQNNGSASAVLVDTGVAVEFTLTHQLTIFSDNSNTRWYIVLDDVLLTGATITSQIPTATTDLGLYWYVDQTGGAAKNFDMYEVETVQLG